MIQKVTKLSLLAKEWVLRAQDDELSIKSILKDRDGSPNTVCFLSQQMAEKLLKSFLAQKEQRIPKVHTIDDLVKTCAKIDPDFSVGLDKSVGILSDFYIATRYPGDYPEFSFKDAEEAFSKAKIIKEHIFMKLSI